MNIVSRLQDEVQENVVAARSLLDLLQWRDDLQLESRIGFSEAVDKLEMLLADSYNGYYNRPIVEFVRRVQ